MTQILIRLAASAACAASLAACATVAPSYPTHEGYVAQGAERWLKQWARSGWQTQAGQPVKHSDLWQAIAQQKAQRRLVWHCLKNEITKPAESHQADALAKAAAR